MGIENKELSMKSHGYAAHDTTSPLVPFDFERREPGPKDVVVEIAYCGICHSDIHQVKDEWGGSMYPMVPGHEIVGTVTTVGKEVTKFKVGDLAGVGVTVETCMACDNCKAGAEPYCTKGMVGTYNAKTYEGEITYGGYANNIVAPEHYVYTISPKLDLAAVAPLLCAGITTYSPLRHWAVGPGKKVGVVGLGGLGHMGLKFAHSFGAHVVQFTTSESKIEDAKKLGADEVVITKDAAQMAKHAGSFDFILDCVSAPPRPECLPRPASPERHTLSRRPARGSPACRSVFAGNESSFSLRLNDRRNERDAGDARLLRRKEHRLRHRADLSAEAL